MKVSSPSDNISRTQKDSRRSARRLTTMVNGSKKVLKDKAFKKHFGGLWEDDALKTMPKGYDKDHATRKMASTKEFYRYARIHGCRSVE